MIFPNIMRTYFKLFSLDNTLQTSSMKMLLLFEHILIDKHTVWSRFIVLKKEKQCNLLTYFCEKKKKKKKS